MRIGSERNLDGGRLERHEPRMAEMTAKTRPIRRLKESPEAVRWFRTAAEQGLAAGQYGLGLMYANGEGPPSSVGTPA